MTTEIHLTFDEVDNVIRFPLMSKTEELTTFKKIIYQQL